MTERVVGADLSLAGSALVYLESSSAGGSPAFIRQARLKTPKGAQGPLRMNALREQFLTALDDFMPDLVVVEGFALGIGRGNAGHHDIAGWGWIARWTAWSAGYPLLEVPPATLKKFATGKGNSPKEIVIREVHRRWNYEASDNNDADAYALAELGRLLQLGRRGVSVAKSVLELEGKCVRWEPKK